MKRVPDDADGPVGEVDRGEAPENLTGAVVTGLKWTAAQHIVSEGARIGLTLVLARLLTPTDYGIAGMALVVTAFVGIFADPSLGAALIQRPQIDERDRSTVFWVSAGLGLALTLAGIATAGLVADLFGEPEVRELFMATSLTFLIGSLATVPRSLLARRLAYRSLEVRQMVAIVIGALAALAVALAGFGPWAIVINMIVYTTVSTALLWLLASWFPRLTFSRASLVNLGGFGIKVFTASVISWANVNLDKVLVGRVLGAASLGAYSLAYNVMFMPMTRLARPIQGVLSPAYSRIQDDVPRLEAAWLLAKRLTVAVTAPIFVAILVCAPDLVEVAFGSKWDAAILPLQILCIGGIAHTLSTFSWPVLQATGATGTLLRLTILISVATWTSFVVGLAWGIVGVAASYTVVRCLLTLPETWMTARAVGFRFSTALTAGLECLPFAALAAGAGFAARAALVAADVPSAIRLVVAGAVTVAAYLVLMIVFQRAMVREVRAAFRRSGSDAGSAAAVAPSTTGP